MEEIENDIINDLTELDDAISRYTYLTGCAVDCAPLPEAYRHEEYLIPECQVRTWAAIAWEDGTCRLYADSESLIVRGALALLQEIYEGRTSTEVREYQCHLLEHELFSDPFTAEQRKGLTAILKKLAEGGDRNAAGIA